MDLIKTLLFWKSFPSIFSFPHIYLIVLSALSLVLKVYPPLLHCYTSSPKSIKPAKSLLKLGKLLGFSGRHHKSRRISPGFFSKNSPRFSSRTRSLIIYSRLDHHKEDIRLFDIDIKGIVGCCKMSKWLGHVNLFQDLHQKESTWAAI